MKYLILMRGSPGAGKSFFLNKHKLEQYVICPDTIRLLYQSPILKPNGELSISQRNDGRVWNMVMELVEERMKRGELTIVDATHSKDRDFNKYKKLVKKYRYYCYCIDMTDVPIEQCKEWNRARPDYKFVPEDVIDKMYARFEVFNPPNWVKVIKPDELEEVIYNHPPIDLSHYKKIHHIGDIHGCYTVLKNYIGEELKDDEFYIFLGDYTDRGIENADVVSFMISIKDKENVMMLEGNHEKHLWDWANNDHVVSKEFRNNTQPELEKYGVNKKDVRMLYRKMIQMAFYKVDDIYVLVTHGGISKFPGMEGKHCLDLEKNKLKMIATEQFIKGTGSHGDEAETDREFNARKPHPYLHSVHGHRNVEKVPIKVNSVCYNLDGGVEFGGYLRTVTLVKWGEKWKWVGENIKNDVCRVKHVPDENIVPKTNQEFIKTLRENKFIRETVLERNISSFNFTDKAFRKRVWNDQTIKARGLFLNTDSGEIVIRSYDKFFNVGEEYTKMRDLEKKLKFPVNISVKYNGFLGLVGYDSQSDELVVASKSTNAGTFSGWFREIFYKTLGKENEDDLKEYLKKNNVSLVFEVIDPENDPHIIKYSEKKIVLLDIVRRKFEYQKMEWKEVKKISKKYGFQIKEVCREIDNWQDFYNWFENVNKLDYLHNGERIEGFVIEDSDGFMAKIKLEYYWVWKKLRTVKDMIGRGNAHKVGRGGLTTPLHNYFYKWCTEQTKSHLQKDIITLREEFLEQMEKDGVKVCG